MWILARDNSSHYYVIPENRLDAWDDWRSLPDDDQAGWIVPDYATRVAGYQAVRFPAWEQR